MTDVQFVAEFYLRFKDVWNIWINGWWCRNVTSPTINQQYLGCFLCYLAWNLWYCRIFAFLRQLFVYTARAFQSDKFEGEFSIYRGMSGSSYFISVNQILASARLSQRKLFYSLQIATSDHVPKSCCTEPISDAEKEEIDNCIINSSTLVCFYVAGFLARRGNFPSNDVVSLSEDTSESEFFSFVCLSFAFRMVVPVCLKLLLFLLILLILAVSFFETYFYFNCSFFVYWWVCWRHLFDFSKGFMQGAYEKNCRRTKQLLCTEDTKIQLNCL